MSFLLKFQSKITAIGAISSPVLLSFIIFWLTIEYVGLGKFSLAISGDNISVIPYYFAFYDHGLSMGNWTPFPSGGTDLKATGYSTIVFQTVFSLLPGWLAFQVLTISPIIAGVLGVYGLCRRVIQLDKTSSIFAAFAYGAFYFDEFFFTTGLLGYLPLSVLTLSALLDNKYEVMRWVWVVAIAALLSHSSFISRLVPWPLATYLVWFALVERRRNLNDWCLITLFSTFILTLRWEDVVSLIAYAPDSVISEFRTTQGLTIELANAASALAATLIGKFYVSGILLTIFILSIVSNQERRNLGLLSALLALISFFFIGIILKSILVSFMPFISGYNFTHIFQNFYFVQMIAGGVGIHFIKNQFQHDATDYRFQARYFITAAVTLTLFIMVTASDLKEKFYFVKTWVTWGSLHQNTRNPELIKLAEEVKNQQGPTRALSINMRGTLLNSYGIETLEGYHPLMSDRYKKFWVKLTEKWRQSSHWQASFGARGLEAITAILPATVNGQGWERANPKTELLVSDDVNMNLMSLANVGYIISREKLLDEDLILISGPEQSWSALSRMQKLETNLKASFTANQHIFIYRNPNVLTRAFMVKNVQIFDSRAAVLKAMGTANLESLANTAFIEKSTLPENTQLTLPLEKYEVSIISYTPDRIEIEVLQSKKPGFLVITNTYSPYWKAKIDGIDAEILPTDATFWGVTVPAGSSKVVFEYRPPYLIGN